MTIKEYIQTNEERFLDDLFEIIRIPSISSKTEHKPDMVRMAEHWCQYLKKIGMNRSEVYPTMGNPVVYAERIIDPSAKTILIYGHYDVMPAEPLELWKSEPFEPVIRDGHIWARGADDDKGQTMIQVAGLQTALALDLVKCNVKIIFEGEEEIGSTHLGAFCEKYKDMLKADAILVSDTSMVSKETPTLTTGLRGLAYWEIEVTGPNRDLHSGHFGGAVANPINELSKIIAQMVDEKGRITIPHFYDDIVPLSQEERDMIAQIPFSEEKYKKAIDVDALFGEEGYSTLERNSCRPSFDVCGIWGGYTGEGAKTVLPSKAYAKVSTRLVANQDHSEISQQFVDYVKQIAPPYVRVEVTPMHGGEAYLCPIDLPAYKAAEQACEVAFGKRPLAIRRGGSIPIIAQFEKILGVKSVLMGFGLESNAIHSPNENFPLDLFRIGIEAVAEFYRFYR
ncbi:peptidase M20 [Porphyromonas gingivicanis]|uniref:Peptidase M20 n=1 Tax=Porphyromonas gingivicanis TaxID=266762 RepID=A0A0A2G405_9PORP|nr:dipeptidase [Porphyromonas gingivicanis]KGN97951.1 peptidase M20 [Porphyromonas gingivicanis]